VINTWRFCSCWAREEGDRLERIDSVGTLFVLMVNELEKGLVFSVATAASATGSVE